MYLIDPHLYMTPGMVARFRGKYAFRNNSDGVSWVKKHDISDDKIRILDGAEIINKPFAETVWSPQNYPGYFDPFRLSRPDKVCLSSGRQAHLSYWKTAHTAQKQMHFIQLFEKDLEMYRVRFNALSVVSATLYDDLDVIEMISDTLNLAKIPHIKYRDEKKMPKELSEFAKLFGSARSSDVLAGARMLVQRNAQRLELAIQNEEDDGEGLSKEVSSLANSVFGQALALAKIMDPSLRAGPKVAVQVNSGSASSTVMIDGVAQPGGELSMAQAMKELQEGGVPLRDITDEMMVEYMAAKSSRDPLQIAAAIPGYGTVDANQDMPF